MIDYEYVFFELEFALDQIFALASWPLGPKGVGAWLAGRILDSEHGSSHFTKMGVQSSPKAWQIQSGPWHVSHHRHQIRLLSLATGGKYHLSPPDERVPFFSLF